MAGISRTLVQPVHHPLAEIISIIFNQYHCFRDLENHLSMFYGLIYLNKTQYYTRTSMQPTVGSDFLNEFTVDCTLISVLVFPWDSPVTDGVGSTVPISAQHQ